VVVVSSRASKKPAPRSTITLTLPIDVIRQLQEIANLAGLTVDQVVSVVIASRLVQLKREGGTP
jgi:cell division ATPase FtsA